MKNSSSKLSPLTLDYIALFQRLQSGNTLITANSRLARLLEDRYNNWRLDQGDLQWPTANILAWNPWLDRVWENAVLERIEGSKRAIPNSRQVSSLWEQVLRRDKRAQSLLRPESLANQLRDTRSMLKTWGLSLTDFSWLGEENENHAAFHHWNSLFEQACSKNGWLPGEDRINLLVNALNNKQFKITEKIDLIGFDEINPAQQELLNSINVDASQATLIKIVPAENHAVLFQAEDTNTELQHMARWVRHCLENNPQAEVAIVVPDLHTRRADIERQLTEILTPGLETDSQKPWNISIGEPLARAPMIETAFDLLQWLNHNLDIETIGRVLRSPWLQGADTELSARAQLERRLRDTYPRQLKLTEVRYQAQFIRETDYQGNPIPVDQQEANNWTCPELVKVINKLLSYAEKNQQQKPASLWAESFDKLLAQLGWPLSEKDLSNEPGEETLQQSQNWQTLSAWNESLSEFASLDATLPLLSRNKAINLLRQVCMDRIFQPKTTTVSIQVLGIYEASSLRFDHLWVPGLHADNWPPAARPNPFIPGKLQQAANLPNSSPTRELEVARIITQRLLETATDTVFSYPGKVDGEEQLPSPLLNDPAIIAVKQIPEWTGASWKTSLSEAKGPDWEPLQMPAPLGSRSPKGGSRIIKNQALCPFRAFAENRLFAESLNTPVDGIDPRLHGSLLHAVLELFWKQTKTQAALMQLDINSLAERVQTQVEQVTSEDRGLNQRPAFREVEARRLQRQVLNWLEHEKLRAPFTVIGFEDKRTPLIEGQEINLYIDRIDQLENGEKVIIDYKTGKVDPKKWFGDRPEDPQLPLYAISSQSETAESSTDTPAAVVFAIVRDDENSFKGVVNAADILPGLPPTRKNELQEACDNLPATIDNWRYTIHRLMKDFLAGDASIDPKNSHKTCENSFCKLQPLCRISELSELQLNNIKELSA